MVADGYTTKAIAHALGRTTTAVTGMCKKAGLRVLRGATIAVQVQLAPTAYAELKDAAKVRHLTANTLARIVLELSTRSPEWLAKLLDDDMAERNLDDEALPVARKADTAANIASMQYLPSRSAWELARRC
jgi:hypothetical protein